MKHTVRILGAVLALSMLLTGCSLWQPFVSRTPEVAATYGDGQELATGEYLAYMYQNIYDICEYYENYNSQAMYYGQEQIDPFSHTYTYGEGDNEQKDLTFEEYVTLSTPDNIKLQIALDKLIADKGISIDEAEYEDYLYLHDALHMYEDTLKNTASNHLLPLGINDEHYHSMLKKQSLNFYIAYYGLYGKGGVEEVKEEELRKYFNENYLSYKTIDLSLTLTDEEKKAAALTEEESKGLSDKEKKEAEEKKLKKAEEKKLAEAKKKLEDYQDIYDEKGFEKAVDQYKKDNAKKDEKIEASKDEDNRISGDKNNLGLDENLQKEIEKLKADGKTHIVEYTDSNKTKHIALILRLDINEPKDYFDDCYEDILSSLKLEPLQKEVEELAKKVELEFNQEVLDTCTVEQMMEDMEKATA